MGFYGTGWRLKFWEPCLRWMRLIDLSKFTIITKTFTHEPRKGNGINSIRFYKNGIANANGLRNSGFDSLFTCFNYERIKASIISNNLIISLSGSPDDLYEMGTSISKNFALIKGIELNAQCPNDLIHDAQYIIDGITALRLSTDRHIPIGIKFTYGDNITTYKVIDTAKKDIEWININSVPWRFIFPTKPSPFYKYGGGAISGKLAQEKNWEFLEKLQLLDMDVPIIAPDIWDFSDILQTRLLGAQAYSFGSVFMYYPWRPNNIINTCENFKSLYCY